jgi:hypothetical protein
MIVGEEWFGARWWLEVGIVVARVFEGMCCCTLDRCWVLCRPKMDDRNVVGMDLKLACDPIVDLDGMRTACHSTRPQMRSIVLGDGEVDVPFVEPLVLGVSTDGKRELRIRTAWSS